MRPTLRSPVAIAVLVVALGRSARADDQTAPARPEILHDEEGGRGLTLGSKRDQHVEAQAILWLADMKSHSHFLFDPNVARADTDVKFVKDLGLPARFPAGGFFGAVGLDVFGWVGGEIFAFNLASDSGRVRQATSIAGIAFQPNELIESDATFIWGAVFYGWEVRWRFLPDASVPIDVYGSPTFGAGVFHLDVGVRRAFPNPTPTSRQQVTSWTLVPGARVGVEVMDCVRVGVDLAWIDGTDLAITRPRIDEWERVRVFLGVRVFDLEATIGWRYANTGSRDAERAADVKVRGFDASFGVRF